MNAGKVETDSRSSQLPNSTPTLSVEGTCATITLNRPSVHNRIEPDDVRVLGELLLQAGDNRDARVLVLRAHGKSFSSGYHIGALEQAERNIDHLALSRLIDRLETLRLPTICALNGSVFGAGADLALACDFRIGVTGMKLRIPAGRLALHYAFGGLKRFVSRLGPAASKSIFLLAREIEANDLLGIGYLHQLVPSAELDRTVDQLASALSELAPLAIQGMKATINDIAAGVANPDKGNADFLASLRSQDAAEAIQAWRDKRKPQFIGK